MKIISATQFPLAATVTWGRDHGQHVGVLGCDGRWDVYRGGYRVGSFTERERAAAYAVDILIDMGVVATPSASQEKA